MALQDESVTVSTFTTQFAFDVQSQLELGDTDLIRECTILETGDGESLGQAIFPMADFQLGLFFVIADIQIEMTISDRFF